MRTYLAAVAPPQPPPITTTRRRPVGCVSPIMEAHPEIPPAATAPASAAVPVWRKPLRVSLLMPRSLGLAVILSLPEGKARLGY